MPDTIRERIFQDRKTVLETITTANGFENDLVAGAVARIMPSSQVALPSPHVILLAGQEVVVPGPDPLTTKNVEVWILLFVRLDELTDARSADQVLNLLMGDIEKALNIDITCGSLALDCELADTQSVELTHKNPNVGQAMMFMVKYRHLRTDPFSLG
ncbi:MAG: hypothetical protein IID14_07415 [Candidatus Marinimicrobia bacterium]|nr:hypothetical protein [Candidatus Neomarinimicrobiota bacterium]